MRLPGGEGFDDRLVFLGDDTTGRALEVMAVPLIDGLRAKWRPQYEEGKR